MSDDYGASLRHAAAGLRQMAPAAPPIEGGDSHAGRRAYIRSAEFLEAMASAGEIGAVIEDAYDRRPATEAEMRAAADLPPSPDNPERGFRGQALVDAACGYCGFTDCRGDCSKALDAAVRAKIKDR